MGTASMRFVSKALPGQGWRIWDRMQKKWWGQVYSIRPTGLLTELNGQKRPAELARLTQLLSSHGQTRRRAKS